MRGWNASSPARARAAPRAPRPLALPRIPRALLEGIDADHGGVGGQGTRSHAHHAPTAGQVVQQEHAVGQPGQFWTVRDVAPGRYSLRARSNDVLSAPVAVT